MARRLTVVCCMVLALPGLTADAPASQRIGAAGDIACDHNSAAFNAGAGTATECRQMATSQLLLSRRLDAVLTLGDNQYENARPNAFAASYDPSWGRLKAITRPSIGNHEYYYPAAEGYFDYFNGAGAWSGAAGPRDRGWYRFRLGGWQLIALNSNCTIVRCGRDSAQYRFLERALAGFPGRCTLAYFHHPRFSSGEHGNDIRLAPFWGLLVRHRAELVLSGHDHHYERFAPKLANGRVGRRGIRSFVVGTGGRSTRPVTGLEAGSRFRDSAHFGILRLTLRRRGASWAFVPAGGGPSPDRGRLRCR